MVKTINSILLIDDDDATNFFNKMVIEGVGYSSDIEIQTSGQSALDYLKHEPNFPSLIFLDINMPGMDGWEFLDHFQATFNGKQVIIVMLTTSQNPEDQSNSKKYNVHRFLSKPLTGATFEQVLTDFF